jgi:hypothetical protein
MSANARPQFMKRALSYLGVLKPGGGGGGGPSGGGGGGGKPDYTIRISKSRLRVDKQRRTKVRLACGPTLKQLCRGVVTLRRGKKAMGRKSFTTTANRNRNITVRIRKSAYKRLKRTGKIRTTITVVTRGSDGVLRKKTRHVTMVRKTAKKAKKKQ